MIVLLTCASNNQPVALTKQIADSGEGQVWETNLSGYLAKIYHDPTTARIAKLQVMLANPPADPMLSRNHISIAWPSDLLQDSTGRYLGFLMPAIADSKQLSSVYNPRRRKRVAAGFNWYYLHVTALNTAWIVKEIHAKDYVFGDIKTENILVNNRALVSVIDTDSFQVQDALLGKIYRCTVGSEGFTPPELLGQDFATNNQTEVHDRFRLGVLIHYLLFGYHPFSGQWIGEGESPEQTELIRQGYWYGGYNSLISESKTTIPLDVVHPELKKLFLQCFNDGHQAPHLRPTTEDWLNALQLAVNQLQVCDQVDNHYYSQTYGKCHWCDRATKLGVDIFPTVTRTATTPATTISFQTRQSSQPFQDSSQYQQKTVLASHSASANISSQLPTARHSNNSLQTATPDRLPSLQAVAFDVIKLTVEQSRERQESSPLGRKKEVKVTSNLKLNLNQSQALYFTETLSNTVQLDMISLPAGAFMMGSPSQEPSITDRQQPQHRVKIKPFFMAKLPVTQAQWQAVASLPKIKRNLQFNPSKFQGERLPVERVTWEDAVEFCNRLAKYTGREYRLPSEAEWEYACRAGTKTRYHFGETITDKLANYRPSATYAGKPKGKYRETTTSVGKFTPNAFGLYDMHGNVWEWCADNWHKNYKDAPTDGSAWLSGDNRIKVTRGGSWGDYSNFCRSAHRSYITRDFRSYGIGFRVACDDPRMS